MKVAVSAYGPDLSAQVNPRFGRCDYLLIVDTDAMTFESFNNESMGLSGGAGIQTASFVVSKGVEAVLTGDCGPKAMDVFNTSNVKVYAGQSGTVQETVNRFKSGTLAASSEATAPEKSGVNHGTGSVPPLTPGTGQGRGMGQGMGMGGGGCRRSGGGGRGMGGGGGRGMGGGGGRGMGGGCGNKGQQQQ